jgi:hypothetical protein
MSNVKYRQIEPLTDWRSYELETTELDPPVFRCRLRPVTNLNLFDGAAAGGGVPKPGRTIQEVAIEAVADWDLAVEGVPIPLTPENKRGWLIPIIAEQVKGRELGVLLGIAIVQDAQNRENFLKNLPATSPGGSK